MNDFDWDVLQKKRTAQSAKHKVASVRGPETAAKAKAHGWETADEALKAYKNISDDIGKDLGEYETAASNYAEAAKACEEVYASEGLSKVLEMLREMYETKALNTMDYMSLYNRYRNK